MGSVFIRPRSATPIYIGAFQCWDAAKGKFVWVQKSTGVTDKGQALAIVATWERATQAAKAGRLSRARATEMINDILRMAGLETVASSPTLKDFVRNVRDEKKVADGTVKKHAGFVSALEKWQGGDKYLSPLDTWTARDVSAYYAHLRSLVADTTANDHLLWLSGIFRRAQVMGLCSENPVKQIDLVSAEASDKEVITRQQQAATLRTMRRHGRKDWSVFASLSWHTGHRIQDVLDVTAASVEDMARVGWVVHLKPRKKRGKGVEKRARDVVLPLPSWLARAVRRIGDFRSLHDADNYNGKVSAEFIEWLHLAGIDTKPVKMPKRTLHMVSHASYRHAMSSRLANAGIEGELARLVTDHDNPAVHRGYVHGEIASIKRALQSLRTGVQQ